jgi:hypothetical protein
MPVVVEEAAATLDYHARPPRVPVARWPVMASHPKSRFDRSMKMIKVTPSTHLTLTALKAGMERAKDRQVTWSEVLDVVVDAYVRWLALAAAAEDGGS